YCVFLLKNVAPSEVPRFLCARRFNHATRFNRCAHFRQTAFRNRHCMHTLATDCFCYVHYATCLTLFIVCVPSTEVAITSQIPALFSIRNEIQRPVLRINLRSVLCCFCTT